MVTAQILLPLVLLVSTPQKGKWVEIGKTSTGNTVFIDPKSIVTGKDGIITAAFRVPYAKPLPTGKEPVRLVKATAMFRCSDRRVAVKESAMYHDEAGTRVFQRSKPKIPGFSVSFSSTFSGVALDYLCKR
jgi:hypothetical protein